MKKYVNSDENKERIIELMREFKNQNKNPLVPLSFIDKNIKSEKQENNNPLVPLSFIKEKIESRELLHTINELKKDKLIHILSFVKYRNYGHKYPFDKLIEDIERKQYLFFDEDANDVYKLIVSKMFEAHEKSDFDMLKKRRKRYVKKGKKDNTYDFHMKKSIVSLLKNTGFSEHESHIISDLFDIKIVNYILKNNIQNINIPLNIKMKVKILEYLYSKNNKEKKEEIEDYSYTTFKNSIFKDLTIELNKNYKSVSSSFSHTIGFLKQEETIETISVRKDNSKNKKYKKYIILKNDEEHFFKLLLKKFVVENHIEDLNKEENREELLRIFEERVKVSKNSKTKITPNIIRYMIENLISKDNENLINNPEFAIYPRNEKVFNVEKWFYACQLVIKIYNKWLKNKNR